MLTLLEGDRTPPQTAAKVKKSRLTHVEGITFVSAGFILKPEGQETRLDDYVEEVKFCWQDSFKSSGNEWQYPKVWLVEEYTVKLYNEDMNLEHCERGNRIQSKVKRELIRHLRQSYLLG
ncbi:hypothetical protein [Microseira sp. BLCC-F43]|jgi:hypothetical protein|uniref:hypothetical protein n=1 Tax=Microseira sp. BLCC-F43 TaxID=3153602 RepID=UPI0035B85CA9